MNAILILFDPLQRGLLPPYGNGWVRAPNFARLAARALTFDRLMVAGMHGSGAPGEQYERLGLPIPQPRTDR